MSTIETVRSMRRQGRYKEASEIAHDLLALDERNADAWWNLALAQHSLGELEESLDSLKTVIRLVPQFAEGWAQYGVVLGSAQQYDKALKALAHALQINPDQAFAARHAAIVCRKMGDSDGEVHYLEILDAMGQASGDDLNQLGILCWQKKDFSRSIDYYERAASILDSHVPYFNLALVYSHIEVSRKADALDCLDHAISINQNDEKSQTTLASLKPTLEKLSKSVFKQGGLELPKNEWYRTYVNPFALLAGPETQSRLEEFDAKELQRLKKLLMHEIELEDGAIDYIEGLNVDKSSAITLCEELNTKSLKDYHWHVYRNSHILAFLTRGHLGHFLDFESYNPLTWIIQCEAESPGFRDWLSRWFHEQYDRVLTWALTTRRVSVADSLLQGRRLVIQEHDDQCFQGARRQVENILSPLRELAAQSKETKPSISQLNSILDEDALYSIIHILPEPFRDLKHEAPALVRDMAITAFNDHADTQLAISILQLADGFQVKSEALTQQIKEDFRKVDQIAKKEREHEAKLTLRNSRIEITKDGVRQGKIFVQAHQATAIRWGVLITGTQDKARYDFLLACRNSSGDEATISWWSSQDIEKQQEHFQKLINAALNYVVPKIYEKIERSLSSGRHIQIGPCSVTNHGVVFEKNSWFSSKSVTIPWSRAETRVSNGLLTVYDGGNPKLHTEMVMRDTENAVILPFLSDFWN